MKINGHEPNASIDFHRGAITRPTGEQKTVFLTRAAVLGFVAMMLLFLWLLVNVI